MDMEDDAAEKQIQFTSENVTSLPHLSLRLGSRHVELAGAHHCSGISVCCNFHDRGIQTSRKACGHRVSSWQVNRRHAASSTFSAACQVTRHSKESSLRTFQTRCSKCGKTQCLGCFLSFHHVAYQSYLIYYITSDAGMPHDEWLCPELC